MRLFIIKLINRLEVINMEFLKGINPTIGSLLRVQRKQGYYHYGVLYDDGIVCNYTGLHSDDIEHPENIKVRLSSLSDFIKDGILEVKLHNENMLSVDEIKKRCDSYIGKSEFNGSLYNLVSNNCEHFARWACENVTKSKQVDDIFNMLSSLFK